MRLPRSFTILHQTFKVEAFAHILDENNEELCGDINHEHGIMRLSTHQAHDSVAETYLHEMLHGIFKKAGLETGSDPHEDMVNRLTPILLHTLRENPAVLQFLLGRTVGRKGSHQ